MTDEALARVINGMRSRPHGNCTDLYRWLHARHEALEAELHANSPSWTTVAQDIGASGIMGRFGAPLTGRTVRRVWKTVCRDIAASKSAAELERMTGIRPGPANHGKRLAADWRPSGFTHPNAPPPSGGVHQDGQPAVLPLVLRTQPDPSPPPGTPENTSRPAPGSIDAAWQTANLRSGLKANGDPLSTRGNNERDPSEA